MHQTKNFVEKSFYFWSMNQPKRYLVTSALPYANGPLHLGHLAGAYIPADIYVRYLRSMKKDVVFVCGSDEHGAAITIKAIKEKTTPQAIIDHFHEINKDAFAQLGISFDIYHRTSASIHHETSQDFFRTLHKNGEFYTESSEQYFDTEAGQFLADRYIKGTCPKCGNEDAYGDQCEKCGSTLTPMDLIHPKSTISGSTPVLRATSHWYLSLDKHTEWLEKWIEEGLLNGEKIHDPKTWKNHVLGQCKSWLGDLQPRAMTRDLDWGVDVPQELEGSEGKKLYVWLDAPIGYISATKQWAIDNQKEWEPYWKSKDTKLVHFIGKDNIVFHCIIFPAILKAHGEFILPDNIPANQFMNLEGKKLSTSRGWAVWADDYIADFSTMPHHIDMLRYYMIKTMPEQKDSDFTWQGFQEAVNSELVNNLANFTNRVMVLTHKYYEGIVPNHDSTVAFLGSENQLSNWESEMVLVRKKIEEITQLIEAYEFRQGLKSLMELSTMGNSILTFNEPWKMIKTEPENVKTIMNICLQITAGLSVMMEPFLPFASASLRAQLQLSDTTILEIHSKTEALISSGSTVTQPEHLFNRVSDEMMNTQLEKLLKANTPMTPTTKNTPAVAENCTFDDFSKIDLRTGQIKKAEKLAKSDKLLVLEVDLGFEVRTIVSGIAEHFEPEDIIGQHVVIVANLAPRKLRGVESQGMILMAENEAGKLSFVAPNDSSCIGYPVK